MAESGFVKVAEVGELSPGEMKSVKVGRNQVLLANVGGVIYACDDVCTHAYGSLTDGDLNGDQVECPLHGSVFNVVTGEVVASPAEEAIQVFQVRIEGPDILVGPPKS